MDVSLATFLLFCVANELYINLEAFGGRRAYVKQQHKHIMLMHL